MNKAVAFKRESPGWLHRELRSATRCNHASLDRMMLGLNLAFTEEYGVFLRIHYSALQLLKTGWRDEDQADFSAMLDAIFRDLTALAIEPTITPVLHTPVLRCHRMGIAYVIRGSRIGAAYLLSKVRSPFPTAYLGFMPLVTWHSFLNQLDPVDGCTAGATTEESIAGATITFEIFASLLAQTLERKP